MTPFRRRTSKEQIGQVLLQRGIITSAQLKKALELQRKEGGLLGEVLIKMGFISEEDIVQALAIQHDFPYIPLDNYQIDAKIVRLIPQDVARKYEAVAIDKMQDLLVVAMANPLNTEAVATIESITRRKIEMFVSTSTEIKRVLDIAYSAEADTKTSEGGKSA
jgi:hypothetical protein